MNKEKIKWKSWMLARWNAGKVGRYPPGQSTWCLQSLQTLTYLWDLPSADVVPFFSKLLFHFTWFFYLEFFFSFFLFPLLFLFLFHLKYFMCGFPAFLILFSSCFILLTSSFFILSSYAAGRRRGRRRDRNRDRDREGGRREEGCFASSLIFHNPNGEIRRWRFQQVQLR